MTTLRVFAIVSMAMLASACARRADAIVPATIPSEAYLAMGCSQLSSELATERARLAGLEAAQNNAATGDAVGVFLVGVPVSSAFGGNQEGQVAVSKGRVIAIENALGAKRCPR